MFEWSERPDIRLEVAGTSLEYACWGPAPEAAATIVMLHEGLGSLGLWRDMPRQVSEQTGMGVLAFSRAGYGASDTVALPRPLDYMTREAEGVLGAVLDVAGIRQALLMGHSDGATVAAIYGGSVSDMRVRGLILLAPHFFTETSGLAAIRAAGQAYRSGDLKTRLAKHHANPEAAFLGWHDSWTDPAFEDWNVADAIDHLRIPVLAIQGRDDPYGTLAQINEIESRIYSPVESLILDNCGHDPLRDRPDETLAAIKEFCARLDRLERTEVHIA